MTPEPATPELATVDKEWLLELARAEGVEHEVSPPGVGEYFHDLSEAVARGISEWLSLWVPGVGSVLAPLAPLLLKALLLFAGVAILILGIRRWLTRRPRADEGLPEGELALPGPVEAIATTEIWAVRFSGRLEAGEIAEALEALWWWLATHIAPEPADPTWTSRELLRRARRNDLRTLADRLDRQIYGPEEPGPEQVRALFRDLQEVLG